LEQLRKGSRAASECDTGSARSEQMTTCNHDILPVLSF
jgi:hypothetical protein